MKKNMGSTDKLIRILIAFVIIALYFMEVITGTTAIILLSIGAIFVLTSLASVCPLYLPFGLSTCKTKKTTEEHA